MSRRKRARVVVEPPSAAPSSELPPAPPPDRLAQTFFFTMLLGLLAVVVHMFSGLLSDIVLALLLASVVGPVYRALAQRLRVSWLAAALSCALVAVVLVGPVVFVVVSVSREAAALIDVARTSLSMDAVNAFLFGDGWLAERLRKISAITGVAITPETVKSGVLGAVGTVASFAYERTNVIVSNVFVVLFHLIITLIAMFYLLIDGVRFREFVLETSPLPDDEDALIIQRFQSVGRAIIFGNGVGSVAQGVIGAIAMAMAGFESTVLWGTVMTFAAFLPMVGVSVVTVPATLYLVAEGRYLAAIVFFGLTGSMALVFENVVKTRLIGSQVRMHDFVILLSILAGISLFGLMGLLYGPLVVALLMVVLELYQTRYRRQLLGA